MFSWSISLGQLIVGIPIFSILVLLRKMDNKMTQFRIEHEFLMSDWARRQTPPVELDDLPWRKRN